MLRRLKSQKGFTLIELIMVIVILAVLGIIAIPIYVDLRDEARASAEQGVVGAVRGGLMTYFVDPERGDRRLSADGYPAVLDAAAVGDCDPDNPCFTTVLDQEGVTQDWAKVAPGDADAKYQGPTGTCYEYLQGPEEVDGQDRFGLFRSAECPE